MNAVPELTFTMLPPPWARITGMTDCIATIGPSTFRWKISSLYLVAAFLYSVFTTCIVFGFEFFALQKLEPAAFGSAVRITFWGLVGYSLGNLTPARISGITAVSRGAAAITSVEGVCTVVLFVILVFTVLTAARETYRSGLEEVTGELERVAEAITERVTCVYRMTLAEIEVILLKDNADLVNWLRRAQGLPDLALPAAPSEVAVLKNH